MYETSNTTTCLKNDGWMEDCCLFGPWSLSEKVTCEKNSAGVGIKATHSHCKKPFAPEILASQLTVFQGFSAEVPKFVCR